MVTLVIIFLVALTLCICIVQLMRPELERITNTIKESVRLLYPFVLFKHNVIGGKVKETM